MMCSQKGLINRIERFSHHDGPGIRTLVVMKGCPLKCRWCSSPHTQSSSPEVLYVGSRCQGCGSCLKACRKQAISRTADPSRIYTDRGLCGGCGDCVASCPNNARELSGRYFTPEELFREVEKDAAFYRRSHGGVTVGGGEPTMQTDFVTEFISRCRLNYIHTAMETSAFISWTRLEAIIEQLDLIYIDVKHMNEDRHAEWTGVSNRLIHENIERAAQVCKVILRIPLIPGFNDSRENISETAFFAKGLGANVLRLELLPYHKFGMHKYEELDRIYEIESIEPPSDEHMRRLQELACAIGIDVEIGG